MIPSVLIGYPLDFSYGIRGGGAGHTPGLESTLLLPKDGNGRWRNAYGLQFGGGALNMSVGHGSEYELLISDSPSPSRTPSHRTLGVLSICFLTYFNVCGGPWGSEEIMSYAGPLPGFIGLVLFPLLWGVPMALITSELSSRFPRDGGYSLWVSSAFGPFWGFQESYWSWFSGIVDNAVYPALAYETCIAPFSVSMTSYQAWAVKLALTVVWTVPNLFAARLVGRFLVVLAALVLLPFIIMTVVAPILNYSTLSLSNVLHYNPNASFAAYMDLLGILYWNFSGFDCTSTVAGHVKDPSRTYIKGLLYALGLVFLTYFLPLVVAVSIGRPDPSDWDDGWWTVIAKEQVGGYMMAWILAANFIGNAGMFVAEMFEDAWQLSGMARAGLVPRVFQASPGAKVPLTSVLFSFLLICLLVSFDFNSILVVDNFFSILSTLLEFGAFVQLRTRVGDQQNTYRIPLPLKYILYISIPALAVALMILYRGFTESVFSASVNSAALVAGVLLYLTMKRVPAIHFNPNT